MSNRFEGKSMVVTGAASGIGKAIALMAASQGASVIVADLNEDGGQATVDDIRKSGGKAEFEKINLTEFRTMLTSALAQQVRSFKLEDSMDASYLLRQLKLQTVMRSPVAYAVINETRYSVGDTLTLPLMAGPSDLAQIALLNSLVPPAESMTTEAAAQYQVAAKTVRRAHTLHEVPLVWTNERVRHARRRGFDVPAGKLLECRVNQPGASIRNDNLARGEIADSGTLIVLAEEAEVVVAQSEVQRQPLRHLPVVLQEETPVLLIVKTAALADGHIG